MTPNFGIVIGISMEGCALQCTKPTIDSYVNISTLVRCGGRCAMVVFMVGWLATKCKNCKQASSDVASY